jgi:D-lactate dehydrogenase
MRVAMFDTHKFEKEFFETENANFRHEITYFDTRLTSQTISLASGFPCVCCFVNDVLDKETLCILKCEEFKLIALRSAGYNNVDIEEANRLGFKVVRVPAYSPHAVAEHAVGLLLSLNRKIHKAYARVHELNFSLDGLVGFDLCGKTVGVIGTGKIGAVFAEIMSGFRCRVLASDVAVNPSLKDNPRIQYVSLDQLYRESDIISLHVPLTPQTHHLIDTAVMEKMKSGVFLINTGRGALIDTKALVESLKSGKVGGAGLDVYEEEENVFFEDLSGKVLQDDVLARLLTFPNVLITSHQGFLTKEALQNIASTTLQNISDFESGKELKNEVTSK